MCGIAGVVDLSGSGRPRREELRRMAAVLRHRGPDEFGLYRDPIAGLAHARLSIIDLATGQQPLSDESGKLWIVFNGEIFNYVELREELKGRGHRFRTASDTEVVVHAWEEWGEGALNRFNGQFAFALWDRERRRLVLARDRMGIRPLYYSLHGGRLYFASEVKGIFVNPEFPREFDAEGLDQVFTFWTTIAPVTPFRGVRELRPGHYLELDAGPGTAGDPVERPYWSPRYPDRGEPYPLSVPEAAEALRSHLEEATRLRILRSDVPVGSYLSGGIDSSVVAALGRRFKEGTFRTFSVRFADAEFDETRYQEMMTERLRSEHASILCERKQIAEVFPEVIYHTERPVLRTAPAPLLLLSRLVHESGFKVVLTGEASDELLAGYDIFREAKVRAFWARRPDSVLRPRLLGRLYPYLERSPAAARAMAERFFAQGLDRAGEPEFAHIPRWNAASSLKRLFSRELSAETRGLDSIAKIVSDLPREFAAWDPLAQAQFLEIRTILSGYILASQGDRMLMSHSVEGRFPFLDPNVIDFCNGLPPSYKLKVLDEKHVLKRSARDLVPDPILRRPKQPYRAPDAPSFAGRGAPDYVDELLGEAAVRRAGLFEAGGVTRLLDKCRAKVGQGQFSNADNMAFIGVLSSQLLWAQFVKERPRSAELPAERLRTQVTFDA